MRWRTPDQPCYCMECDKPALVLLTFENPQIVQNSSLALCYQHAKAMGVKMFAALFVHRHSPAKAPLSNTEPASNSNSDISDVPPSIWGKP